MKFSKSILVFLFVLSTLSVFYYTLKRLIYKQKEEPMGYPGYLQNRQLLGYACKRDICDGARLLSITEESTIKLNQLLGIGKISFSVKLPNNKKFRNYTVAGAIAGSLFFGPEIQKGTVTSS